MLKARRDVLEKSIKLSLARSAYAASPILSLALTACGGGSGNDEVVSPNVGPNTPSVKVLTIALTGTESQTAVSAVRLKTSGLDVNASTSVVLTSELGDSLVIDPIRVDGDGTVVFALPLCIDAVTGLTRSSMLSIQVQQSTILSNKLSIRVEDIPASSTIGLPLGELSISFITHLMLTYAIVLNKFSLVKLDPAATTDISEARAELKNQLSEAIKLRKNITRIASGEVASLSVGLWPNGEVVSFNSSSIDLMDRIIAKYLLSISPSIGVGKTQSFEKFNIQQIWSFVSVTNNGAGVADFLGNSYDSTIGSGQVTTDDKISSIKNAAMIIGLSALALGVLPGVAVASTIIGITLSAYSLTRHVQNVYLSGNLTQNDALSIAGDLIDLVPGGRPVSRLIATSAGLIGFVSNLIRNADVDLTTNSLFEGGRYSGSRMPSNFFSSLRQAERETGGNYPPMGSVNVAATGASINALRITGPAGYEAYAPPDATGHYYIRAALFGSGLAYYLVNLETGQDVAGPIPINLSATQAGGTIDLGALNAPQPSDGTEIIDFTSGVYRAGSYYQGGANPLDVQFDSFSVGSSETIFVVDGGGRFYSGLLNKRLFQASDEYGVRIIMNTRRASRFDFLSFDIALSDTLGGANFQPLNLQAGGSLFSVPVSSSVIGSPMTTIVLPVSVFSRNIPVITISPRITSSRPLSYIEMAIDNIRIRRV